MNLLTITTLSTRDDNTVMEEDTLDDVMHDFGVYTDIVNIVFDEEELSDSGDEDDQQALREEDQICPRI
jgi:hypothetical protein